MSSNPTPSPATPDSGMTFDAAPVTTDTPVPNPSAPDAGMTFDSSPTQQAITVAPRQNPLAVTGDTTHSLTGAAQQLNAVGAGIGEGVLSTANGAANLLHIPHATMQQREAELKQDNSVNPWLRRTGLTSEALAEFAMGDEALKGLTASEKFLKAAKLTKTIEDSPLLTRLVAGAIRGGTVGATQGGVKTNTATGAVEGGLGGAAGGVAGEAVPAVVNAGKSAVGAVSRSGAIQDTLQNTIRNAVNDAAKDAGVDTSNASSIRDVAKDVSDNMLQSARKDYQALDQATGGRVQRFSDAIKNVQQKLRDIAGLDPDVESNYVEKLNTAQDAHDAAMREAEDAGLPKGLIDKANASFKQSKAMLDLSKQIQASSEGLRPEMADGANRPIAESVNPKKLSSKLDKMIDSGRVQQAIGPQRTTALRAAANDAHAATQSTQSFKKYVGQYAPHLVGGAVGGGVVAEIFHHLLGE